MQDLNFQNDITYYCNGMDVKDFRGIFKDEAQDLNERGYDIFWCVNRFKDNIRQKVNLEFVNSIVADFDNVTFDELKQRLRFKPHPTMIIKTRSGLHMYWHLKEPQYILPDDYREFVEQTLCAIGADKNAKDVCRILRPPGFRYWQDSKKNRYEDAHISVEIMPFQGPRWDWLTLKRLFSVHVAPIVTKKEKPSLIVNLKTTSNSSKEFWKVCNNVDVERGILTLSGKDIVKNQTFSFKQQGELKRLYVNGKNSNSWIDTNGRFGSTYQDTAGTLVNFLKFPEYGLNDSQIAAVFKELFNVK